MSDKVETKEAELRPEDKPLFDSLWKVYEDLKNIRITSEYLARLLQEKTESLRINSQGIEKILSEKYPQINFDGDYRIKDGKIIQEVHVVLPVTEPETEKKIEK